MENLNKLINFLTKAEDNKIYYTLSKIRDSILVSVAVPGERWEIEFMANGDVECEKFVSNGEIFNDSIFDELFRNFSD